MGDQKMGIREKINQHPTVASAAAVAIVLAIGLEAYHYLAPSNSVPKSYGKAQGSAYYTTDDGATIFGEVDNMTTPFIRNGKPAVKAYVFLCSGQQIVAYLEKYSGGSDSMLLVKKPKAGNWIPDSDPRAQTIRQPPNCPDGATPVLMTPPAP
jgi:hypothetical protein